MPVLKAQMPIVRTKDEPNISEPTRFRHTIAGSFVFKASLQWQVRDLPDQNATFQRSQAEVPSVRFSAANSRFTCA